MGEGIKVKLPDVGSNNELNSVSEPLAPVPALSCVTKLKPWYLEPECNKLSLEVTWVKPPPPPEPLPKSEALSWIDPENIQGMFEVLVGV